VVLVLPVPEVAAPEALAEAGAPVVVLVVPVAPAGAGRMSMNTTVAPLLVTFTKLPAMPGLADVEVELVVVPVLVPPVEVVLAPEGRALAAPLDEARLAEVLAELEGTAPAAPLALAPVPAVLDVEPVPVALEVPVVVPAVPVVPVVVVVVVERLDPLVPVANDPVQRFCVSSCW